MLNIAIKLERSPYKDGEVYEHIMTFRGESPCVAPTRRKRGPRPLPIGRRGRLPTWTAAPRRAFPVTLSHYRRELNTLYSKMPLTTNATKIVELSLAVVVLPLVGRARAMVRVGLMAMAAQPRLPGLDTEAAAAERRTARAASLRDGSNRGRRCCVNSAGASRLWPRQSPTVFAKNGTKDKNGSNGTEGNSRREATDHEELFDAEKRIVYEEHRGGQFAATLPVRRTPVMLTVMLTATNADGLNAGTREQATLRKRTGRRLALTSPRPAWPRCAWIPAAPSHGAPRNSPVLNFYVDSERYHQDLDWDRNELKGKDLQIIEPTVITHIGASPITAFDHQLKGD